MIRYRLILHSNKDGHSIFTHRFFKTLEAGRKFQMELTRTDYCAFSFSRTNLTIGFCLIHFLLRRL